MANSTEGHAGEVRNPGPFEASAALRGILVLLVLVGVAAFAGGLAVDRKRAWFSFLHNHFYFLSLALGGMFFAAVQWVTGAMWSAPLRRVAESFTAYIPVALVAFAALYFGMHDLYLWTHPEHVRGDIMLEGKQGYLNVGFFVVRNAVAFAIWIFFSRLMIGRSVRQDRDGNPGHTQTNKALSPLFLILFAITYTMSSFDQLMSLDPHWFSTMFGVYCFAGLFYSVLALTCLVTIFLRREGKLAGIVNENHLHDLGKFMFAFSVFYAYIGFCQFMLIWYANMPEETGYFIRRMSGSWMGVTVFLLFGKFMVPFFFLLPREAKRDEGRLIWVGIFMLVAHWIDLLWISQPELFAEGPKVSWIELGTAAGFLGLFGLAVVRFLGKHNVVAIRDPKLAESVFHHHQ